jgi:hypothetical protein
MLHNYWLGIMALAFAAAIALWIVLVFRADSHPGKGQQEQPTREVMGGEFVATEGGRQLMPHFGDPVEPLGGLTEQAAGTAEPGQAAPQVAVPEQSPQAAVPAQGGRAPAAHGQPAASVPAQGQAPQGEQAQLAASRSRSGRRWPFGSRR